MMTVANDRARVAQNDETIENLKRNRRQDKQIDRRDAVDVILEKRPPSLRQWPRTTAQDPGAAASAQCPRARIVSPGALETPPAPHTNVARRVRPARTRRPACCSRHLVTCRRPRRCEAYDDRPLTKESPTWRRSCESSRAAPCRAWVAGARQVPGLPRRAWRPPQP
jgi:hypothetical protein